VITIVRKCVIHAFSGLLTGDYPFKPWYVSGTCHISCKNILLKE